jgi:non-specific serine/threonine protein kinase
MGIQEGSARAPLYRYRFGAAEIDETRLELRVGGLLVDIEQKPLKVLIELLRHAGEAVSREELLDAVWDGRPTVPNVLTNAVAKLRRALGSTEGACVHTLPSIGYQLNATVERVAVGRRLVSRLELKEGEGVPGREHFLLAAQIGASRGSEVWLARHRKSGEPLVYKFSPDGSQLASLKREASLYRVLREALGEREDLVRIRDWNFETAPFYLECEYGGSNLEQWAAGDGQLRALSRPERLALFLQIAEAVAAAHGVGVLHRDLKPTNILVAPRSGGGWQVRVGDFGSGRLLEPGMLQELNISQFGLALTQGLSADSRSGTPLYLAPEIVAGQPTTVRSDVYALGLILYQLLAGDMRRPMASGWEQDIGDSLLCEDIAAATSGDPLRRLGSAGELLQRLRSLEQRRAERESARRAAEQAQLNQRALARAAARRPWLIAALASLLAGIAASLFLYRAESAARQQAEREAARAEAINRFLNEDLIGAADPIAPGQQSGATIAEVLDRAAVRIEGRFADDPASRGGIELALGKAYFGLGDYAAAERYQRQAAQRLAQSAGPADSRTLEAQYVFARTLMLRAQYSEVEALLDKADAAMGPRLEQPSELALRAWYTRGGLAFTRNQPQAAIKFFEEADRIRAKAVPEDIGWLFKVRGNLAWAFNRVHRERDTVALLSDLLAPRYSPEQVGILDFTKVRNEEGIALTSLGQFDDAARITQGALKETERTVGPQHVLTAVAYEHLAMVYQASGNWSAALQQLESAYPILLARFGDNHRATAETAGKIGALHVLANDNFTSGLLLLQKARERLLAAVGESDPVTQDITFYLSLVMVRDGRIEEAATLSARLDADALASAEPGYDWRAQLAGLRGMILSHEANSAEAADLLGAALAGLSRQPSSAWMIPLLQQASALKNHAKSN